MAPTEAPVRNQEIPSATPPKESPIESPFDIKLPCFRAVRKNGIKHTDYFFNTTDEGSWILSIDRQRLGSTSVIQDVKEVCDRLGHLDGEKNLNSVEGEGFDRDHKRTQRFLQANWETIAKNLYPFDDFVEKILPESTAKCFVEVPINRVKDGKLKIESGHVDLDGTEDSRVETDYGHVDLVGIGTRRELYIVEIASKKSVEIERDGIALLKGKESLIRGGGRGKFKQLLDYDRGVRKYLDLGDEFVAIPLMVNYIPSETGPMKLAVRYAGNFPVV